MISRRRQLGVLLVLCSALLCLLVMREYLREKGLSSLELVHNKTITTTTIATTTAAAAAATTTTTTTVTMNVEFDDMMASRQQERKRQLSVYCKNKNTRVLRPKDLRYLIVDHKHKLLYCYVPKVACTTWKGVMARLTGQQNKFNLLSFHSEAKARVILQTYYKFLFVREPYERLLSAYKNKFSGKEDYFNKKYGRKIIRKFRRTATSHALLYGDDVHFPEFVAYLIDVNIKEGRLNEHWRHYEKLCHPCEINYDFIGHYETLETDAPYVLREAGVENLVKFPRVRVSTTTNDLAQYYSSIPRGQVSELRSIYRDDFEMFGYNHSEFLGRGFLKEP